MKRTHTRRILCRVSGLVRLFLVGEVGVGCGIERNCEGGKSDKEPYEDAGITIVQLDLVV